MSFCPSNDIHSIYLDDELPQNYKVEYEKHVSQCPKCQKKLEQLKNISFSLHQDSLSLQADSHYLDESFNRLQIKMSYRKNSESAGKKQKFNFTYALGAVAAAAVFALFIPFNLVNEKNEQSTGTYYVNPFMTVPGNTISQVTLNKGMSAVKNSNLMNNVSFDSGKSVLVSGNIKDTVFSSDSQEKSQNFAQNIGSVDVLRPEFEENTISIRITIPGVGQIPVTTEFSLPVRVMSGKFQ